MDYNDEDYRVVVNVCFIFVLFFQERRRNKAIHVRWGLVWDQESPNNYNERSSQIKDSCKEFFYRELYTNIARLLNLDFENLY